MLVVEVNEASLKRGMVPTAINSRAIKDGGDYGLDLAEVDVGQEIRLGLVQGGHNPWSAVRRLAGAT